MKKIFFIFLLACGFEKMSQGQVVDTVQTVDYGKMPPVYFSNKVYWERNYDNQNHLLFEGLKYNSCFIGAFINYWDNGKVKTRGQYIKDTTGDWASLQTRGLCSTKEGVWENYSKTGGLIKTVLYKNGEIIKEY